MPKKIISRSLNPARLKLISHSGGDTEKIARNFLAEIFKIYKNPAIGGANKKALVIGLSGELGAGKTHLTKAIAKIFGIKEKIASPTFVIMKHYKIKNLKFKNFYHLDAYRLKKDSELLHLGWEEIISNPEHIVLIEWPELVAKIMPKKHHKIKIKYLTETSRE